MPRIPAPQTKIYRKLRYRKGYGVHSPFVYNLINKVIEEKSPFYAFDEIEKERENLLRKETVNNRNIYSAIKETQSKNYGRLLFRLVNFFRCRNVLQFGGSSGIMSLYLSMALPSFCDCYVLDEQSDFAKQVLSLKNKYHLEKLHVRNGNYEDSLVALKPVLTSFDLIFINHTGDPEKIKRILNMVKDFITEDTVLVIDGIKMGKGMRKLWKELKEIPETRVSMDLYTLGILFFSKKLQKQHYKNYFNYGKKQNIHPRRRRWLNLFGGRKKSSENESKDRRVRNR